MLIFWHNLNELNPLWPVSTIWTRQVEEPPMECIYKIIRRISAKGCQAMHLDNTAVKENLSAKYLTKQCQLGELCKICLEKVEKIVKYMESTVIITLDSKHISNQRKGLGDTETGKVTTVRALKHRRDSMLISYSLHLLVNQGNPTIKSLKCKNATSKINKNKWIN